uniref:Reverse transcriptase Ty1/copia-type domain-containing protein n=1 Tax=Solanum lycopersicum TaxID=4081 RepID=A0A3Q7HIY5_SOLLC
MDVPPVFGSAAKPSDEYYQLFPICITPIGAHELPSDDQHIETDTAVASSYNGVDSAIATDSHESDPSLHGTHADEPLPNSHSAPLRKSTRQSKPPTWMQDYVSKSSGAHACIYPISAVLGYTKLSSKYQAYLAQIDGDLIQATKDHLQLSFKIKDLGDLKYFLGIEFARNKDGILMHQRKYVVELISDLGFTGAKPFQTPLEVNKKLTSFEFDQHMQDDTDHLLSDPGEYQRLIGRLLYLTITRPDIAFAVQYLSQYMHSPKVSHMVAATRVIKYVKQSPGLGVFMSAHVSSCLTAYCDADWAACIDTRKSVTGFLIKLGDSPISWKSKKQSTISRSSAEAEYRSLASTVAEVVWLTGLLKEIGVIFPGPELETEIIEAVAENELPVGGKATSNSGHRRGLRLDPIQILHIPQLL